jgi:transcriptional regulator NrdR family protein
MAAEVTKKDGTKVPFDAEKIKKAVMAAAARTELQEERKSEVAEQVTASVLQMADAKEEITTSEIREKALSELDALEPSVSQAWRAYDEEKKGA